MAQLVLTPAGLFELLVQIQELSDVNVSVEETQGGIQITIGDSIYKLAQSSAIAVEVPNDVVDEVESINSEVYEELQTSGTAELSDPIEGGPIKELLKTLAIGGLVRLTTHMLTK